jgi:putative membrane protein
LWVAVAVSIIYTAMVCLYHPDNLGLSPQLTTQFAVVNTAVVGLLISFRTKIAYDRWWEGRMLWGSLINHSRNFALKIREYAKPEPGERELVSRLLTGFAFALKHHLRGSLQLTDIRGFERATATPQHAPAYLAQQLFGWLHTWRTNERIDGHMHQLLDSHCSSLMDICGACERVRNTPLPMSYLSLLRHGLVLGFLLAPWAVVPALGWWSLLVQSIVIYFLFGIELTAEAVEQPFGSDGDDLPLESYCETIRASVEEILQ